MRVMAKVQLSTGSSGPAVADTVIDVLDRWVGQKLKISEDGSSVIRRSGVAAEIDRNEDIIDNSRRDTLSVLQPVNGGDLQTDVDVIALEERTVFRCTITVTNNGGVNPNNVQLRPPRFVRDVVALGHPWTVGVSGERVFAQYFTVENDDVGVLEELMSDSRRRLPIIMVSELHGETLAGDVHERLSQDICGLAHVVRLSEEAGWALTRSRGKEWSCFNGAVRIIWPLRSGINDPRAHPTWTRDWQLQADSAAHARDRLRAIIASRILEASTFVADDPAYRDFSAAKMQRVAETMRIAVDGDGDMGKLAHAYAQENDSLRRRVSILEKQNESLQQNVEALIISARASPSEAGVAEDNSPPQTIGEAVETARERLAGKVIIARETDVEIGNLSPAAGPPEKVLRYLLVLGDLADALSEGPIGNSVPIWLRTRNVECSVDSESTKSSERGKKFRNRFVEGELVECEFHAKPSEGVSPDLCVRIYFATSSAEPHVKVGYIGRHIG